MKKRKKREIKQNKNQDHYLQLWHIDLYNGLYCKLLTSHDYYLLSSFELTAIRSILVDN